MPYIKKKDRNRFDEYLSRMPCPETSGELNYIITRVCLRYLTYIGVSYSRFNDIFGALSCASMEFYRRWAAKYEDTKIAENGDV